MITDGIQSACTIMIIVAAALAFGHWMTDSGIPATLVKFTLLVVMLILTPALIPIGFDPVHFAIVFTHNMEIALVRPPVGLNPYVLATISRAPVLEVVRATSPS